ncbi:MAG TPA: tetratricopeptide repeat protein, partial [Acidobacteriota bacterium]
ALISFWYDWNWELAEQSFQHALQLNPNDSPAHIWYATFLSMMGRFPEVEVEIRSAQKLDPLSPLVNSLAGCALYMARAYDEALLEFQKALDVDTDFLVALSFIGSVYIEKSMFNEARAAAERAVKLSSRSSFSLASYGSILAVLGHTEEAQSVIAELQNRSKEQYVPAFCFAMIHIGMKDYDRAFAFLEESLQDRNIQICFLKESPGLDSLRSDPRFRALLHRVPFP